MHKKNGEQDDRKSWCIPLSIAPSNSRYTSLQYDTFCKYCVPSRINGSEKDIKTRWGPFVFLVRPGTNSSVGLCPDLRLGQLFQSLSR